MINEPNVTGIKMIFGNMWMIQQCRKLLTINEFTLKSANNGMQLEEFKGKKLRFCFLSKKVEVDLVIIIDKDIEVVSQINLLDLTITNYLKWNLHIRNICKKVSTCLYFLQQLK